ncbi:hypothetical protein [uncultured Roseobacter sp.]|uniref:hypothetical protein n=1 Tax=uncultured Roseobacter sp. TaxID=114847 RepID=UPI00261876AA|nr:hypothetical protein [uncultured Roseobacter sp.]
MAPRVFLAAIALAAVSACAPQVPDSGQGVGFDNSFEAQQQRDAALSGGQTRLPDTVVPPTPGSAEATAAETTRILAETRPATLDNPGISNENDFDAVAERQTIESDAERIANNRAQYEVVQPEALPTRPGDEQPNIVAFALSTSHPKGQSVYARAGFGGESRAARNCAAYASPDLAQIDFLARGGPTRDRKGLDPDGDGYACTWDPAPFRKASEG